MRHADLIASGTSFCTTCGMLPFILWFARRHELYDPSGPLKIHTALTPRLGGVAITAGLAAGTTVSGVEPVGSGMLSLSLLLVWATGLIDDLFGLSTSIRLIIQATAGVLVWRAGWSVPIGHAGWNLLATVLFIICFINALNMLDGADGLAAGVSSIVVIGFIFLTSQYLDPWGRAVEFSLLGSCIGFLLFNFPPAKLFMGDSGSNVLGFALSVLALNFYRRTPSNYVSLLVPILFAGIPLLDAAFAVVRRLSRRLSPFAGDREHSFDLLLRLGWSARKVAFAFYALTAILVSAGLCCEVLWKSISLKQ
jgi:UDP-GlcNAc:undecaprenyl-phosphate/decaprenyl-phosphate GlcNAc-1-phosphate transferase